MVRVKNREAEFPFLGMLMFAITALCGVLVMTVNQSWMSPAKNCTFLFVMGLIGLILLGGTPGLVNTLAGYGCLGGIMVLSFQPVYLWIYEHSSEPMRWALACIFVQTCQWIPRRGLTVLQFLLHFLFGLTLIGLAWATTPERSVIPTLGAWGLSLVGLVLGHFVWRLVADRYRPEEAPPSET